MKTKTAFYVGILIAFIATINWSCKKDDDSNDNPPGQDTFTDSRDGKTYKTITVDSLVWFAENLDYDTAGAYDYPTKSTGSKGYGKLYEFGPAKTACPAGWRLASDNDWTTLLMQLGMNSSDAEAHGWNGTDQGKNLKSTTGWRDNGNGTDLIGFNALPAGYIKAHHEFYGINEYALFWTSTLEQENTAYVRGLAFESDQIEKTGMSFNVEGGASVRCVKDVSK